MKRLKTFAFYILILVTFFVLSRIIIFIGLNNTYSSITPKNSIPDGIEISYAKATSVNGKVTGKITGNFEEKYAKFNFYADTDSLAGTYYISISELTNNDFEFYFKLNYINSYSVELTNEAPPEESTSNNFSSTEYQGHILFAALIALMFI